MSSSNYVYTYRTNLKSNVQAPKNTNYNAYSYGNNISNASKIQNNYQNGQQASYQANGTNASKWATPVVDSKRKENVLNTEGTEWATHSYFAVYLSNNNKKISQIVTNSINLFNKAIIYVEEHRNCSELKKQFNESIQQKIKIINSLDVVKDLSQFRDLQSKIQILITDLKPSQLFKGAKIDCKGVNMVINQKIPKDLQEYVSRITRDYTIDPVQNKGVVVNFIPMLKKGYNYSTDTEYIQVFNSKLRVQLQLLNDERQINKYIKKIELPKRQKYASGYPYTSEQVTNLNINKGKPTSNLNTNVIKLDNVNSSFTNNYTTAKQFVNNTTNFSNHIGFQKEPAKIDYSANSTMSMSSSILDRYDAYSGNLGSQTNKDKQVYPNQAVNILSTINEKQEQVGNSEIMTSSYLQKWDNKSKLSELPSIKSQIQRPASKNAMSMAENNKQVGSQGQKKGGEVDLQKYNSIMSKDIQDKYKRIYEQLQSYSRQNNGMKDSLKNINSHMQNLDNIPFKTAQLVDTKIGARIDHLANSRIPQLQKKQTLEIRELVIQNNKPITQMKQEVQSIKQLQRDQSRHLGNTIEKGNQNILSQLVLLRQTMETIKKQQQSVKQQLMGNGKKIESADKQRINALYDKSVVSKQQLRNQQLRMKQRQQYYQNQVRVFKQRIEQLERKIKSQEVSSNNMNNSRLRVLSQPSNNNPLNQICKQLNSIFYDTFRITLGINAQNYRAKFKQIQQILKNYKSLQQKSKKFLQQLNHIFDQHIGRQINFDSYHLVLPELSQALTKNKNNSTAHFLAQSQIYLQLLNDRQKAFLYESIKNIIGRQVKRTKTLFEGYRGSTFDQWMQKISHKNNLLVLMVAENNYIFAGFTQDYFTSVYDNVRKYGSGFMMSLTNMKLYGLKPNHKGQAIKSDRFNYILGNNQMMIKSNFTYEFIVSKLFTHYQTDRVSTTQFMGEQYDNGGYKRIQFHQIFKAD